MNPNGTSTSERPAYDGFDHQVERVGWALFLIMIGALALMPDRYAPHGAWLLGVGLIMIGMNAARLLKGTAISVFTVVLGVIALAAGLSAVAGVAVPVLPILLTVVGIEILYKVAVRR